MFQLQLAQPGELTQFKLFAECYLGCQHELVFSRQKKQCWQDERKPNVSASARSCAVSGNRMMGGYHTN